MNSAQPLPPGGLEGQAERERQPLTHAANANANAHAFSVSVTFFASEATVSSMLQHPTYIARAQVHSTRIHGPPALWAGAVPEEAAVERGQASPHTVPRPTWPMLVNWFPTHLDGAKQEQMEQIHHQHVHSRTQITGPSQPNAGCRYRDCRAVKAAARASGNTRYKVVTNAPVPFHSILAVGAGKGGDEGPSRAEWKTLRATTVSYQLAHG